MSAVTTCYYNDNFNPVIIILIIAGVLMVLVFIGFVCYFLLKPKNEDEDRTLRMESPDVRFQESPTFTRTPSPSSPSYEYYKSTRVERFPTPIRNILGIGLGQDEKHNINIRSHSGIDNKGFNGKEFSV